MGDIPVSVQLVKVKDLPERFQKDFEDKDAIVAVETFLASDPEHKIVKVKENFMDYLLERDPGLPKRMANPHE